MGGSQSRKSEQPGMAILLMLPHWMSKMRSDEPSPTMVAQLPLLDFTDNTTVNQQKRRESRIQKRIREIQEQYQKFQQDLETSKASELPTINCPADAANLVMPAMSILQREELWLMVLNTRNRVKAIVKIYQGSANSSQIRISEILRAAILKDAQAVVLIHNHPSSDVAPSPDDVVVTKAFVQACNLLDITCLDHIVVGGGKYTSLKERGLGFS